MVKALVLKAGKKPILYRDRHREQNIEWSPYIKNVARAGRYAFLKLARSSVPVVIAS